MWRTDLCTPNQFLSIWTHLQSGVDAVRWATCVIFAFSHTQNVEEIYCWKFSLELTFTGTLSSITRTTFRQISRKLTLFSAFNLCSHLWMHIKGFEKHRKIVKTLSNCRKMQISCRSAIHSIDSSAFHLRSAFAQFDICGAVAVLRRQNSAVFCCSWKKWSEKRMKRN